MLKFWVILFLMAASLSGYAQQMPEPEKADPANVTIYTDIASITQNPDSVLYIDLSGSKLKSIPPEVFLCTNLVYLDLKRNKIDSIPAEIGQLKKLRVLNMSRNKLQMLPPEIGQCTELRSLILNQNEITELCPEIGKLIHLAVLDLWGNSVDHFPNEITRLSETLQYVDLRVIYMTREAQEAIELLLPETTIFFSNGCNCH